MELARPAIDYRSFMEVSSLDTTASGPLLISGNNLDTCILVLDPQLLLLFLLCSCRKLKHWSYDVSPQDIHENNEGLLDTVQMASCLAYILMCVLAQSSSGASKGNTILASASFVPSYYSRLQSRWGACCHILLRISAVNWLLLQFIAFFLADELNSLAYSLQNIYFIACSCGLLSITLYNLVDELWLSDANKWPGNIFTVCPSGRSWPYALFLCLPALSRLIQCLKRYHDSKLNIHLINVSATAFCEWACLYSNLASCLQAGKYSSVIAQQCLFVWWRNKGNNDSGASFIIWVIIATLSAIYTCSWVSIVLAYPMSNGLTAIVGFCYRLELVQT